MFSVMRRLHRPPHQRFFFVSLQHSGQAGLPPAAWSMLRCSLVRTLALLLLAALAFLDVPQSRADAAPTATSLAVTAGGSAATSVISGTVVTLTATVISGSTPVSPGQVKFCVATAAHCEDSALLATVQLTSAGVATYKFRPGIGSHSYQAVFVGTSSYTKSTSTTADFLVTGTHPTTTMITSSGMVGDYTLTATVTGTGSHFFPTGTVSFLNTTNANLLLGKGTLQNGQTLASFMGGPTTAGYPNSVGDFNGDGILDLVTSSDVMLGNGDGTFNVKPLPALPASALTVAAGDFNGDGVLDLAVVVSATPDSIVVLLGNGDGTFTQKSTIEVGNASLAIAVGDFNGDGILDLVTANAASQTLTVLLGKGDGTFTIKSSPGGFTSAPYSVVVGDFNGDGILDLAAGSCCVGNNGTVMVFLGNGDGTFTAKSTSSTGNDPASIAVADFNGDGIPDMATANQGGGGDPVTVLLGNGDGTFTAAPAPSVSGTPISIVTGDFNGDGIPDLVTGNLGNSGTVLYGNGDGTFTTEVIAGLGELPGSIVTGDFNGDGIPDVAGLEVLLGQLSATATASASHISVSGAVTNLVLASYPGNTNYSSSSSGTTLLYSTQVPTTLTLGSSAGTSVASNSITLTVTLTPFSYGNATTNGETVTFYNGGTSIGTGTLSTGVATLTTSSLPVGSDALTAAYSGDGAFVGSASGVVTVTVSPIVTTLQLYSNPNPSMSGASVTLSAILSPDYSNGFSASGETVTFYNGGAVLGTGTINENAGGAATLTITSLPDGIDKLTASYPGDGIFSAATSNTVPQAVGVPFPPIPNFVVTVKTDTTAGVASNCTSTPAPNCSLRDALAAAFANGSGNITFDPAAFSTPQTIAGGQSIPPHTTITGPTTGSGATLSNLVTVSGGGPVFTVNSGVTAISNLTITGGSAANNGGGILNSGALVVSGCTISGNVGGGYPVSSGGGIENYGTLTLINSTVTGNSLSAVGSPTGGFAQGGGIDNQGTLTIINSSVVGNSLSGYLYGGPASVGLSGGGINNNGTLTMTNSVVAGNSANANAQGNPDWEAIVSGGGIEGGITTGTNNIISGNTANGSEDDCDTYSGAPACPTSGQNGNLIGASVQLAPLGNYGGPTQTQPPLPGSTAICAGIIANIPAGVTTDQRGFPRTTTYGSNPPCVDSGAVQTNYSVSFTTEPPSTVPANIDFTAVLQLSENGNPFPLSGFGIPIALAAGDNGALNVGSLSTNSSGVAGSSQLTVSAPGTGDMLVASFPLTASGVTPVATASAKSTAFNVTPSTNVQVTIGSSPAGIAIMVDGVSYSAPVTLTWTVGAQHTLSATSPQDISGVQYTFAAWSDGGAISHTVTASSATTSYTATFNLSGYLLTIYTNPPQGGVVSSASGTSYPLNTVVKLTATPNPGYLFAGWTGNVASASNPSTTITMSGAETVTANFVVPTYVVTTNLDDATGTAANCNSGSKSPCSLRDALAAAAAAPAGSGITFDPTVFAATQPASARTIVLGSGGTLNVPANTTITGPTAGSGATYTQLVTVNGNNQFTVFGVGATNVSLFGLMITGGGYSGFLSQGGGIDNGGTLTVTNCTMSNNALLGTGGVISNSGTLTVVSSAISGNSAHGIYNYGATAVTTVAGSTVSGNTGNGIFNFEGQVTVTDSTISGNSGGGLYVVGGAGPPDYNPIFGTLAIANSTISGNGSYGIDVDVTASMTATNSIVAGNTASSGSFDCGGFNASSCPTNGVDGNVVGVGALLAPLANYGGPTQTQPPLPGSPAICAGVANGIPATDQRGFPRTTSYGSNPPCVDSGAVQTNYALSFSTQPPAIVAPNASFTAAVQLSESGSHFSLSGVNIPLALGAGSAGTLSGGGAATGPTGVATYSSLQVNTAGYGDTLVASLAVTASGVTPALSLSAVSSSFDVIQPGSPVAQPLLSPPSGTYTRAQSVTITDATPGATIYYTTDGTTPSRSSAVFSATPITVSSSQTVKALAVATNYLTSPEGVATYKIIAPYAATPAFTLASGFYTSNQMVSITDTTAGATIYYTTNGSTPTTSSPVYTPGSTIAINSNLQLKAIAAAPGFSTSAVAIGNFYVAAAEPLISPPSGTYTRAQSVTITDATPGATIYYTTDGTTPGRSSPVFNPMSPIAVSSSQIIKALAVVPGHTTSPEGVATYKIIAPYAATPAFTLASGFYTSNQMVSITDTTAGATIYYTTNGSTPTTSSPVYTPGSTIAINSNLQLKAIAAAPGFSTSAVAVGNFYVAAAEPLISPPTGRYSGTQMVTITDTTPGATIYYTTDGTTPGRSSPVFNPMSPITVSSSQIIKALAVAPGHTTSPEGVASYTIGP